MFSRPFSEKTNSLKIKHFKKIHFFLVSEYGNFTGIKTHHDRLGNSGEGVLERGVQIFGFWKRIEDLIEASDAVRSLSFHSFVRSAHESKKFFVFALDCPFGFSP